VKDSGIGLGMKYYDKLFGVFQRLHSPSEFQGTGIGRSIARRILHLHGRQSSAEGKVNKGAVFYFQLPRESANLP
jgi:light-regulated signal transduction histidine kinase (bacteriophytochrome)